MRAILIGLVIALSAITAHAGTLVVQWDTVTGATYRVYQSIDQGATWTKIAETTSMPVSLTLADNVLVLLRASTVVGGVEAVRTETGIWYDGRMRPKTPQNIAIQ